MTFTFPLLLGGLLAIGIPVALHLLLRQKPKTVLFPAFRFLVKRHRTNLTKLRLRHLLLLALRVLLFAGIVLALAQPKVKDHPWSLPSDQAVAAIFVFDTSASMDYTITSNQTRLKEAQKRAVELLKLLPANSEIVVLDTAESAGGAKTKAASTGNKDWLTREKAAERIGQLRVRPANSPVTTSLAGAMALLAEVAKPSNDNDRSKRARLLCIFSDRTKAAWELQSRNHLQTLGNQVPPAFDRLAAIRAGIAQQLQLLPDLRHLPLATSADFPEQVLAETLQKLAERIPQARADSYPDSTTTSLVSAVRSKQQELLAMLDKPGDNLNEEARAYRDKLQSALRTSLRNSAGFTSFYIDVGIEQPTDLALLDLQLVREEVAPHLARFPGEFLHKLQVEVQATGEDFHPTLVCNVDGSERDGVTIDVKAGKHETLSFDLKDDELRPGLHQAKVYVRTADSLPINNGRYLTYALRRVLVLADRENMPEATLWAKAIEANRFGAALFRCTIAPSDYAGGFDEFAAVVLCGLQKPSEALWARLKEYVLQGHGVGVLPGGWGMDKAAYNESVAAQEVLPARFEQVIKANRPGADWNWADREIYKHPLLHPFLEWKQGRFDIFVLPRGAFLYWETAPRVPPSGVLVRYADDKNRPALIERKFDRKDDKPGRVLLLTTPPGDPDWNNYREDRHSFYVVLAGRTVGYLTGDIDRPSLNFPSSQTGAMVPVPASLQTTSYKLYRDAGSQARAFLTPVTAAANLNEARVEQAAEPGNYTLKTSEKPEAAVSWFSVNLPAAESDLSRTATSEIEAVLGPEAILAVEARTDLNEAMRGHISEPLELFPVLMLILLVALAAENLLANRFYRREPEMTA